MAYTAAELKQIPLADFGDPRNRKYPIKVPGDVTDAWNLAGHADNPDAVRARIKRIAKRKGKKYTDALPATASDEKASMAVATFALPDGWMYGQMRDWLQNELREDCPPLPPDDDADDTFGYGMRGRYYPFVVDFDDQMVVFDDGDFDGDLFKVPYTIAQTDAGKDAQWGAVIAVGAKTIYPPLAEMATGDGRAADVLTGTALFDLGDVTSSDDDYTIRTGVVFRAGDYLDKGFAITPEELAAAADTFVPIKNKGAHVPTIFDGKMGELRSVALDDDGATLLGEIAIPTWLDTFQRGEMAGEPFKASLEWHKATKRIVGNTLIPNPRVTDSALMSAYAAFAGKRHSATDQAALDEAHAAIVKAGANCEGKADMSDAHKIGVFDTLKALFTGESQSPAARSSAVPPARAEEHDVAELDELKGQIATLTQAIQGMQAQFSTTAEQQQRTRAAEYADAAIRANKALPAERDALVALFAQALADDAAHAATVTFGAGEADKGGRVDALVALVKARPAHRMTEELVPDNVTTLFADGRDQKKPGSVADDVAASVAYARANGMAKAE